MEPNVNFSDKAKEDIELVELAKGGDESAFAKLMLRYRESIYFMLLKMVGNKNDAEDLTLEAFGKAFANLDMYSSNYAFSTWLYKIASNNCIDFLRKQKGIHVAIDQGVDYEYDPNILNYKANVPNPEERMILKQRSIMLHRFISKLKPQYRKLLDLRYFKEYSYDEIANELNLPTGTVKVQLFRARNMLYDLISKTEHRD